MQYTEDDVAVVREDYCKHQQMQNLFFPQSNLCGQNQAMYKILYS